MFLFYVLSFFKKGDTIQGGTIFKEIRYTGAHTSIFQEQDKEKSASNSIHDQKMKANNLNKTQFVTLGFAIPRITLENCEETAKVEFHNVCKMNRSTSKVLNIGTG